MISINTPNNLGVKVYHFFLYRSMLPALVCLFAAGVLAVMGKSLNNLILDILSMFAPVNILSQQLTTTFVSNSFFALIAIAIIIAMVAFTKSTLQYRNFSFTLEEFNIKIKRGVLSTTEISVPYRQLQDVVIARDINYKMFGLSRLVLNTLKDDESGDHKSSQIVLEPIDAILADEARQILESKIGVHVIERTRDIPVQGSVNPTPHL